MKLATPAAPAVASSKIVMPHAVTMFLAAASVFIFVDDLHVDFRDTGRLRNLLRLISGEVIRDGDVFALRSSGPSSLAIEPTADRGRLAPAIKAATGNGLKAADVLQTLPIRGPANEVHHRATVALSAAQEILADFAASDDRRKTLIYISSGYITDAFPPLADRLSELTAAARQGGVTIVAIDARVLWDRPVPDPAGGGAAWRNHATAVRGSLRLMSEQTGGFLIEEGHDLADALTRIRGAMR